MASNKQRLEYTIAFTADTAKAKQQLQSLQSQLTNLGQLKFTRDDGGFGITKEIQTALTAVNQLQTQLNNATNVDTGKLDLGKFSQGLKSSNMTLSSYRKQLEQLGPEGDQAFKSLAMSIANAEMPLRRTSQLMSDFAVTMKNTLKWQISSSILHGLMGAMQSAYHYAKNLNASLNDIRIVTGYNADKMAEFSIEANKAARALSATTKEYTNASLIYFQQGLSDSQVKERTDVTVKMANVTRESTETVSDQMTAVWNNFYDGSKSIEYYSDVMVKLGADTASSADEIADGLEKFAAVSNTVGLSYEYAASALTTITAITRQSADVVGTALKTLFARIQGLELGQTLDDGTTLNQYSEALYKVGINIKDSNGQLKEMDTILNEMGSVWETLGKAEQVALAEKVAGVRQYTQLIALMDNWKYFQENLATAYGSEGALQKQADIYAESWEAARDRVTAAAETIYEKLLDDDAFIDLLNVGEKVLEFIDDIIDSVGGLKGILLAFAGIITKLFNQQIVNGLSNTWLNIQGYTKKGQQELANLRTQALEEASAMVSDKDQDYIRADAYSRRLEEQTLMMENASKMSDIERQAYQFALDNNAALDEKVLDLENQHKLAEDNLSLLKQELKLREKEKELKTTDPKQATLSGHGSEIKRIQQSAFQESLIDNNTKITTNFDKVLSAENINDKDVKIALKALKEEFNQIDQAVENYTQDYEEAFGPEAASLIRSITLELNKQQPDLKKLQELYNEYNSAVKNGNTEAQAFITELLAKNYNFSEKQIDKFISGNLKIGQSQADVVKAGAKAEAAHERIVKGFKRIQEAGLTTAQAITNLASGISSVAFAFQSLRSIIDTIKDPDTSSWEKFASVLMSVSMSVPMLMSGIKSLKGVYTTLNSVLVKNTITRFANAASTRSQTEAEKEHSQTTNKETNSTKRSSKETFKQTIEEKIFGKKTDIKWSKDANGRLRKNGKFISEKNSSDLIPEFAKNLENGESATEIAKVGGLFGKDGTLAGTGATLLGVTAAVAVIAGSIYAYNKWINKEVEAAEKAAEEAEKISEMYENAKTSYNNLLSTISSYDESINSFEKLTKGTDEWTAALDKANDEAMQLLKSYKNLEYTINDNGLIIIDQNSLRQQKEESRNQMLNAQSVSRLANNRVEELQLKADQKELMRDKLRGTTSGEADEAWQMGLATVIGGAVGSILGTAVPVIGNAIGGAIGAALAGAAVGAISGVIGSKVVNNVATDSEQEALNKIATRYEEIGNTLFASEDGFRSELKDLEITDGKLVDSLVENMEAVQENTQALILNKKSNIEATKNDIKQAQGTKIGTLHLSEEDENFVLNVVAEKVGEKAEELKDSDEYSHWNTWGNKGKKEDFAQQYAQAMGYKVNSTIHSYSTKVSFKDAEGNEVNDVNFDTIERYLAYQQAIKESDVTLDEYTKKVRELEKIEASLSEGRTTQAADYERNLEILKEKAEQLGLTEKQVEEHYKNSEYAKQAAASSTVADSLMTGIFATRLKDSSDVEKENFRKQVQNFTDQLIGNMEEQQINVAIEASANAKSIDDFSRLFAEGLLEAIQKSFESPMSKIQEKIDSEDGISISDLLNLQDDENFAAYLEATNQQMSDVISKNYSERKVIATDYYNWLEKQSNQVYQQQIDQYQKDLAEWQAIADYKRAEEQNDNEILETLRQNFDNIDFEAYADIDISEAESKIDEISNKIDEISNKQIELALDWSGVDNITNSFKEAGEFISLLEQDVKKVGKTYQLTADQAIEWMKIYPEMFDTAEVTTNGLISLTEADVNAFKEGQETKRDEAVETEITNIELQEEELKAKIAALDADIELAEANATGKIKLEKASAEYLAEVRSKLTDYFIDCGLDEAEANYQALMSMGLNQNEYNELVAKNSKENSENAQKAVLEPMEKLKQVLNSAWVNLKNFGNAVLNFFKNPTGGFNFSWTGLFEGVNSSIQVGNNTKSTEIKRHYNESSDVQSEDRKFALDEINNEIIESLKANKVASQQALASLGAQKVQLEALKNQDLTQFGGTNKEKSKDSSSKDKEALSSEAERYHEINRELSNISRQLDRIEKKKDKAFGGKKLDLIDQTIENLNKQLDTTGEKIDEIKKNFENDQAKLNFFGAKYNSQGEVINYDELYAQEETIYNTAIALGNEDTIEAAEKRWEHFKKIFDQYEDTLDELKETQDKEQEIIDQIAEEKLAKIQYELELKVNVIDMSKDWVDYQLSKLDDKTFSSAAKIAQWAETNGLAVRESNAYEDEINNIFKDKGLSNEDIQKILANDQKTLDKYNFTADEIEELKTAYSNLLEANQTLIENKKKIEAELTNSFNEYTEAIEKNIEVIDKYVAVLNKYKDIADLIGIDQFGLTDEFINSISKQAIEISKAQITGQQTKLVNAQKVLEIAKEELANARVEGNEENIEFWEKEVEQLTEKELECQQSVLDSVSSTLQKLKELYEKQIDDIFKNLEKKIAGYYGDLDTLNEAYERQKTLSEQTLTDYKKSYELNKLTNDIVKKINETDNIKAKKTLRDLQSEIAEYQRDGVKMSEYQLSYLQKEYDLELAKIALEDAQNAKSQVRLTRDANGNYGYTYTANADKVADAQQKYNDALYAAQDLTEQYLKEQQDLFMQYTLENTQAIKQIWDDFNTGLINEEQRDQRLVDTQSYYKILMSTITTNIQLGLDNNKQLYRDNAAYFSMINQGMELSWSSFTSQFDQTSLGKTLGTAIGPGGTLENWFSILSSAVQQAMLDCKTAVGNYQFETNSILEQSGIDVKKFGDTIKKYINNAKTATDKLKDSTKEMAEKMPEDYKKIADAIVEYQKDWNGEIQKIINKNEELAKSYKGIIEQLSKKYKDPKNKTTNTIETIEVTKKVIKYENGNKNENTIKKTNTQSTLSSKNEDNNKKEYYEISRIGNEGTREYLKAKGWTLSEDKKKATIEKSLGEYNTKSKFLLTTIKALPLQSFSELKELGFNIEGETVEGGTTQGNLYKTFNISYTQDVLSKIPLKRYDTGGYTGNWYSKAGKIAMLHEKELVLNKDDTKNMLSTVSLVREIVDKTAKASSQARDVSTSESKLGSELKAYLQELKIAQLDNQLKELEQQVQIKAEFPNVTNCTEIEQALNSLVNKASQYAYRYK